MLAEHSTLAQISEITGYSPITISRVFNNSPKVKKATREKILKVCDELSYQPNSVARALKSNSTNIIYVYIPEDIPANSPFYYMFVAGLGRTLGKYNYSMLLMNKWYENQVCDAVIMTSLTKDNIESALNISKRKKVVLFGHLDGIDSYDVDNRYGFVALTETVVNKGCKNLLYLSIDQDRVFVKDRENGFLEVCESKNISYKIDKCLNNSLSSYNFMKEKFFSNYSDCDAIMCASDDMAMGVLKFLNECNINVPKDIVVTGFDGFSDDHILYKNIITARQPIFDIGVAIGERIVQKIKNNDSSNKINLVKPKLIINGMEEK